MEFFVEITVTARVEAASLAALKDRICNDGWTVFTLLDAGGVSGSIVVRDSDNDVVAEL